MKFRRMVRPPTGLVQLSPVGPVGNPFDIAESMASRRPHRRFAAREQTEAAISAAGTLHTHANGTRNKRAMTSPFATETVWNAGLAGTGTAATDRSLTVGREGEWEPEHLLLLAAESSFMSTVLALAAQSGITVLGYVSSGHLDVTNDAEALPQVSLAPCVVVATPEDAERIAGLGRQAEQASIVARLLGDRLRVTFDVRSVPGTIT